MKTDLKNFQKLMTYVLEGPGRIVVPTVFFGILLFLHLVLVGLREKTWFIMHPLWPLSVAKLSTIRWHDLILIAGILIVYKILIDLWRNRTKHFVVIWLLLLFIILGTNLLQGYKWGLIHPLTGSSHRDVKYWQDQALIDDPINFLENYTLLQPTLGYHSRVHPPGPVLLLWVMKQIFYRPILVVSGLFCLSSSIMILLYAWVKREKGHERAMYTAILFGLLPATQIYLWFSIDGVIALSFLFTLYFFINRDISWSVWLCLLGVIVSGMLTFAVVWLGAVMAAVAIFNKEYRMRLAKVLIGLGLFIWLQQSISGYNYIESFEIARSFEGFSGGFYALVQPASYMVTRIQDMLEPIVFLGPYVSLIAFWLIARQSKDKFVRLSKFGIAAFLIFIVMGAYYTGETARAAYYLIPLIIMVFAQKLFFQNTTQKAREFLLHAVMAQTLIMQIFGFWGW